MGGIFGVEKGDPIFKKIGRGILPMKLRIALLTILCLALAVIPASAQVLYDDGPINGTVDAWTFNFGFTPSDSFTVPANATVTGLVFGTWEFPGDTLISVDWEITQYELSGTVYGSGTASGNSLTDQFLSVNQYGYDIDQITVTGLNVGLAKAGEYWLTLQNGVVSGGNPVYWDENDGPSDASETALGSIPAESFQIIGNGGSGTTPEPSSFILLGSGILGLAGVLRRQMF
jgi:PEP-CTERM motif